MKLNIEKLETYEKTVLKIFEYAKKFQKDCLFLESKSIKELFDFVKNLEYKKDPDGIEFISRPEFSIFRNDLPRDCDDKTLIIACYCELKNIPYKIAVSGKNNSPHHIFPLIYIEKNWIPFDATYSTNKLGEYPNNIKFFKVYSFFT